MHWETRNSVRLALWWWPGTELTYLWGCLCMLWSTMMCNKMRSAHTGITPTGCEQEQGSDRKGRVGEKIPWLKVIWKNIRAPKNTSLHQSKGSLAGSHSWGLNYHHHHQKTKFLLCTRYQYSMSQRPCPAHGYQVQWFHNTQGIQAHERLSGFHL